MKKTDQELVPLHKKVAMTGKVPAMKDGGKVKKPMKGSKKK